jgi:hypothetical protein
VKKHFCPAEQSTITYQGECSWCGESEGSMTQDEIIDMARQAGFYIIPNSPDLFPKLVAFANLVAAKEREACAKVCDELPALDIYSDTDKSMWDVTCIDCADAIRARGQA